LLVEFFIKVGYCVWYWWWNHLSRSDIVGVILYPGRILLVEFFIQVGYCWWNSLSRLDIFGEILFPGWILLEKFFIQVEYCCWNSLSNKSDISRIINGHCIHIICVAGVRYCWWKSLSRKQFVFHFHCITFIWRKSDIAGGIHHYTRTALLLERHYNITQLKFLICYYRYIYYYFKFMRKT
jgi:hypothetical protein